MPYTSRLGGGGGINATRANAALAIDYGKRMVEPWGIEPQTFNAIVALFQLNYGPVSRTGLNMSERYEEISLGIFVAIMVEC